MELGLRGFASKQLEVLSRELHWGVESPVVGWHPWPALSGFFPVRMDGGDMGALAICRCIRF